MSNDKQAAGLGLTLVILVVVIWLLVMPTIAGAVVLPEPTDQAYLTLVVTSQTDDWCIVQNNGNDDDLRPCTDIERRILTEDRGRWCLFEDHSVGRCYLPPARPRWPDVEFVGARP